MGRRCSEYGRCFYQQARRRASNAQLLVVNHALFFADLAVRQQGASILPDYDCVVLDEAHALESVAADHLGVSLTDAQVYLLLDRLYNDHTQRGFLATCHAEGAVRHVIAARAEARNLFARLLDWQETAGRPNGRWAAPPPVANPVSGLLRELAGELKTVRSRITDESDDFEITSHTNHALAVGRSP